VFEQHALQARKNTHLFSGENAQQAANKFERKKLLREKAFFRDFGRAFSGCSRRLLMRKRTIALGSRQEQV